MNINNEVLEELTQKFYPFAFYLLQDELQAMQLIIDVVTASLLNDDKIFNDFKNSVNEAKFFQKVYTLAKKRSAHLSNTNEQLLSIFEKTCVFLSENYNYSSNEMAYVTSSQESDIDLVIISTRQRLIESLNDSGMPKGIISNATSF